MNKIIVILSILSMWLVSCPAFAATDLSSGKIRAEGVSECFQEPPAGYKSAYVDAVRNLLEQVQGVLIESDMEVDGYMQTNTSIKSSVEGVVHRAAAVEKFRDKHGYYHIVVEMPVYGEKSLAAVIMPVRSQIAFPQSSQPVNAEKCYTGVIVDCSGLNLQTAMAASIIADDSRIVYGLENFDNAYAVQHGYVSYAHSLSDNVERAGENPLIVKAIGINRFCNPIVSSLDADRILAENVETGFLSQGKVVFIR